LKPSEPKALILIGASTGGPGHIQKIIQALPADFSAAIIIAQHMGDEYIPSFVNQLQHISALNVVAVSNQLAVLPGHIYICSFMTKLKPSRSGLTFTQKKQEMARYNPDIDSLFESASLLTSTYKITGFLLTGIGDDGAKGIKALSDKGVSCIAESETTAVVYGMPFQAKLLVKDISVKSLGDIIQAIKLLGA
jgi:two-component system, chemotaxis family, protein-glutamate methylesterase/glutaminase